MWFTAPIFEKFRESVRDFYDIMFVETDGSSDGKASPSDEEDRLYDSEENLFNADPSQSAPQKVSNLQTFWNIFNANQGVVILSMPYVVLSGSYLSLIFTAIVAAVSNYTSKRLVKCLYEPDPQTGIEVRVRDSYEEIGEAFGGTLGKWIVYLAMIVEQLSYCTLLLILCGSILHSSFPNAPFEKSHWSMLAFLLVIPNAFMANLGQVAFVSFLTVVIGQVVYVTVAVYGFYRAEEWSINSDGPSFDVGKFFISMGIVVVSYSSQPYMPAIEGSMKKEKHYGTVMDISYISITLVKVVFGLIGYLTFKGDTKQVITNNLPHGPFKMTVNICVLCLSLFSFTFPAYTVFVLIDKIHVSRDWFTSKFQFIASKCDTKSSDSKAEDEILEKTLLIESEDSGDEDVPHRKKGGKTEEEETEPENQYLKRLKKAIVRMLLISFALTVAVIVPHFGLYMSFVGNFTGMCLAFIFPCLFHMKLRQLDKFERMVHTVIIIFGSVSAGAGMYYSTIALVDAYSQAD